MQPVLDTRPSPIAGQWYPGNPQALASRVDAYVAAAELPQIDGEVVAVIAPHAGHLYSGPVAGYAFAAIRERSPEIVAVISPSHYPYPHPLLTTGHEAYETPLGIIPVAADAVGALDAVLRRDLGTGLASVKRDPEHSLEIELPFLQRVLKGSFQLLPVMVRDPGSFIVQGLGKALATVLAGKNAILVASTDLSHFYPQSSAEKLDGEMLRRMEAFDPDAVLRAEEEGKGFACGRAAVAAVLWASSALGANAVKILHYATSGAITGDPTQVVGYGAAAVLKSVVRNG
ncbi:MAG: AmmeMemoRadiSam system protein B [Chloroflexota bacterium]